MSRRSRSDTFHGPFGSGTRIVSTRPSPSMSSRRSPADRLLVVGVGPRARADDLRHVGERPFRAVRIEARTDVENARIEAARHVLVLAVTGDEVVQQIQARHRSRDLGRVDVAVDPQRGLVAIVAGVEARRGREPDVAALEAAADALDAQEARDARRRARAARGSGRRSEDRCRSASQGLASGGWSPIIAHRGRSTPSGAATVALRRQGTSAVPPLCAALQPRCI